MNAKRTDELIAIATPLLRPGESIELVTLAKVGTPSKQKQAWVLLLTTILTLGMVSVFVVARPYYIVLTSQRLLFFGVRRGAFSAPPSSKLAFQLGRAGLGVTTPRRRLAITCYLFSQGSPDKRRLAFGALYGKDASALSSIIGAAPAPVRS